MRVNSAAAVLQCKHSAVDSKGAYFAKRSVGFVRRSVARFVWRSTRRSVHFRLRTAS